jgi:hypothetical protein
MNNTDDLSRKLRLFHHLQDLSGSVLQEYTKERPYETRFQDASGSLIDTIQRDEILSFQCGACLKHFATKHSLGRHHERFPVCASWQEGSDDMPAGIGSAYDWAITKIEDAITADDDYSTCKFCSTSYSSPGNLHKHLRSSVPCNRLAYTAIKNALV